MRISRLCLSALVVLAPLALAALPAPPPAAPVEPVTDDYFGTKVTDNYRYFEDEKNPKLAAWMTAQAQYARAVLDSLRGRKALFERITALDKSKFVVSDTVQRGERYFYQKRTPEDQIAKLYYRDGLGGAEHVLLDPAKLGTAKTHAALDYFAPSWDGRLVPTVSPSVAPRRACCTCSTSPARASSPRRSTVPWAASSAGCPTTAASSTCAIRSPRPA